jgi:redox-sensitive bicupin YhaK (pirin superfamily)
MNIYHPETTRSFRDLGGVKLYQSFHSYYPSAPNRRRLGAMIALDNLHYLPGDSEICTYPYQHIEVLCLVLSGTIVSKDNAGNSHVLTQDTMQLLSAGSGIEITKHNGSFTEDAELLQIWFTPQIQHGAPCYQITKSTEENRLQQLELLVSPDGEKDSLKIKQQVWIRRGTFEPGSQHTYHKTKEDNDVYLFMLQGHAMVEDQLLNYRDGLAISGKEPVVVLFKQLTDLLLIELPH